jgi:hypothetical protein
VAGEFAEWTGRNGAVVNTTVYGVAGEFFYVTISIIAIMSRRKPKQLKLSKEVIKRLNKIAKEESIEKMAERYIDPTLYKVVAITAPMNDAGKHFFAVLIPLKNAYALGPSARWDEEERVLAGGFFGEYNEHIRIPVKPNAVHLGQIVKITISPAEDETIIDPR